VARAPEINRRFGALRVWCLGGNLGMAIVSVWSRAEDLETMRADAEYAELLGDIRDRSDDLQDARFWLFAGSPP
jgi:hypothetical protein